MARFGEVGITLLNPFTQPARSTSATGVTGGRLPTPLNPWSGGQAPGGTLPQNTGLQYTFGVLKPPTLPVYKPPIAVLPPPPVISYKPPIAVLPKPPAISPPTVKPPLALPVVNTGSGSFSITPAQSGGGSAPSSGADSPAVTPDTPAISPLLLGGLAIAAYLMFRGKR